MVQDHVGWYILYPKQPHRRLSLKPFSPSFHPRHNNVLCSTPGSYLLLHTFLRRRRYRCRFLLCALPSRPYLRAIPRNGRLRSARLFLAAVHEPALCQRLRYGEGAEHARALWQQRSEHPHNIQSPSDTDPASGRRGVRVETPAEIQPQSPRTGGGMLFRRRCRLRRRFPRRA